MIGGTSGGGHVGAAGRWLQDGGHSIFAPYHGPGVDNVVEFNLVIAYGEYNCQRISALRFILGSTWWRGRNFRRVTVVSFDATITSTNAMKKLFTESIRIHPSLSNSNLVSHNLTNEGLDIATQITGTYNPFEQWYTSRFSGAAGGGGDIVELASRPLPTALFAVNEYVEFSDNKFTVAGDGMVWNFVAGGSVSNVHLDSTRLNTVWRNPLVLKQAGYMQRLQASKSGAL
ncbi:hypothetical protein BJ138DRAFT_1130885 [Hygrophoropsis aurantiaca]|uniref:Uncharacterized protein n=1 Tax=Hygrophoropsis aurantiaca TaxID=72124 RepID=A0ACB7ZUI4_9AGAM|nr:hypothetical protein BJ138DRAFT_1130885 [Hygrophoropsis aurantiaca]